MINQGLFQNLKEWGNVLPQTIGEKDSGKLKFFNLFQKFGFFVSDKDGSDVFFHFDDAIKNWITAEFLQMTHFNPNIRFSFQILYYYGKHKLSRKAINIQPLLIQ